MNFIREFFRRHKWQRRILTALLVIITGCLAGIWLVPIYRDWRVIDELGSSDRAVRSRAIAWAVRRASLRKDTLRRLNNALDTGNDKKFLAVCGVLRQLRKFNTPTRDAVWLDRWRCLQIEQAQPAQLRPTTSPAQLRGKARQKSLSIAAWVRRSYMFDFIVSGRDNRYVRRAMRVAACDPAPRVREAAVTLAAKLGDDAILKKLIADPDLWVSALAALDAGLAGRAGLRENIIALLSESIEEHRKAYQRFKKIQKPTLAGREKLAARIEVVACCAYALAELRAEESFKKIRELARQTKDPQLRNRLLVVIGRINIKTQRQVMVRIVKKSKDAAGYPPPLAAAAVKLWLSEPATKEFLFKGNKDEKDKKVPANVFEADVTKTSVFYLREAIAVEASLPGDYVAWNIGTSGRAEAFALGKVFLPGRGDSQREYNRQVRTTGAMLLALSARSHEQKAEAIRRISRRIKRVDFFERGSYLCALLILGQREYLPQVRELFAIEEFPRRRVLTALLVAGDKAVLDRMLWNVNFSLDELRYWLIALGVNQVFAATVPQLPRPGPASLADTQLWQMRIMRQTYGIGRADIEVGLFSRGKP